MKHADKVRGSKLELKLSGVQLDKLKEYLGAVFHAFFPLERDSKLTGDEIKYSSTWKGFYFMGPVTSGDIDTEDYNLVSQDVESLVLMKITLQNILRREMHNYEEILSPFNNMLILIDTFVDSEIQDEVYSKQGLRR